MKCMKKRENLSLSGFSQSSLGYNVVKNMIEKSNSLAIKFNFGTFYVSNCFQLATLHNEQGYILGDNNLP